MVDRELYLPKHNGDDQDFIEKLQRRQKFLDDQQIGVDSNREKNKKLIECTIRTLDGWSVLGCYACTRIDADSYFALTLDWSNKDNRYIILAGIYSAGYLRNNKNTRKIPDIKFYPVKFPYKIHAIMLSKSHSHAFKRPSRIAWLLGGDSEYLLFDNAEQQDYVYDTMYSYALMYIKKIAS